MNNCLKQVGWIRSRAGVHPVVDLLTLNKIDGSPEGSLASGYAIYVDQSQAVLAIFLIGKMALEYPNYQIEVFASPRSGPVNNG